MEDTVIPIEAVRTFRNLAIRHLALGITEELEPLIAARIAKRLRDLRLPLHRYLFRLYQEKDGDEIIALWDLLRPRRAHFFDPWADYVRLNAHVGGQLAQGQRRFRLWSAGCGSSEEGYSAALTVVHAATSMGLSVDDLDLKILVTDVSSVELEHGKRAVFNRWQLQDVPPNLRQDYFQRCSGGIAVDDRLRPYLVFQTLNFARPPFDLSGGFDAIFCRHAVAAMVPAARMAATKAARTLVSAHGVFCAEAGLPATQDAGESSAKPDAEPPASLDRSTGDC